MFEGEDLACPTCRRSSLFGCQICALRKRDLVWYRELAPGYECHLLHISLICGKSYKRDDGLFHIAGADIRVEAREEFPDLIAVTLQRLEDGKRFRLNATKPGPWDAHPIAEEILG